MVEIQCTNCRETIELNEVSDDSDERKGIERLVFNGECEACGTDVTVTATREL